MRNSGIACLVATGLILAATISQAQYTWDGEGYPDGNFGTGLNWVGDSAPTSPTTLIFAGTLNLNATNNLGTTLTTSDCPILFASGAGPFIISGSAIRVGAISNYSANVQTIGFQARYNGTRNIYTGAGGLIFTALPASTGSSGRSVNIYGGGAPLIFMGNSTGTRVSYTVYSATVILTNVTGQTLNFNGDATIPGIITLNSGSELVFANGGAVNLGGVTANSGTTVRFANAGSITLTRQGNGLELADGATVTGSGKIGGSLVLNGTVAPGNSIGTLEASGDITLGSTASLIMEIDRSAAQNADLISAGGTFTAGGTLTVVNVGGTLQWGDTFNLFDAASFAGSFTSLTLPSLSDGLVWDTSKLLTDGTIIVVPEPNVALLGAAGLLLIFLRRRTK